MSKTNDETGPRDADDMGWFRCISGFEKRMVEEAKDITTKLLIPVTIQKSQYPKEGLTHTNRT